MSQRLAGMLVIITGTRGPASAQLFAREGAQVALFVASGDSSYVTGTDIVVDGGMHVW